MSSAEMRKRTVQLGSSRVAVSYPEGLDAWFDDLIKPDEASTAAPKWVRLAVNGTPDCYDVVPSDTPAIKELDLGEALATFWERVSFQLVEDLREGIVFHAAVLMKDDAVVLLPGRSGAGKTRLSLWYRARGFEIGTDEVVSIAAAAPESGELILGGALARPLILKSVTNASALLRPDEAPLAQQNSPFGLIVKLEGNTPWPQKAFRRGFIVFPDFEDGAPLSLTALTPGEACFRLLDNCLNVRNLPRGGLPLAADIARLLPAITLEYGETGQLERTLDVLTRQVIAAQPSGEDLAALCDAFAARAAARPADAATAAVGVPESRVVPEETAKRFPRRLTIGMATYDDYDGAYFTVQSIRLSNPELEGAIEFVVIDNNPGGRCSQALADIGNSVDGYRYVPRGQWSGTAIRNAVFEEASSPFVLCIDSHVLIAPGALAKLIDFFEAHPDSRDLLQGPMIYDDLCKYATHMDPKWRAGMYGTWGEDPRGADPEGEPFEIPMHGLGLFACSRTSWPAFHEKFRGFGGEEGYIHEKIRQRGGRTLCLPFLRWLHRFGRPMGPPYVNRWEDRMRNYTIGFGELGLDTAQMEAHFGEILGAETAARIFKDIRLELAAEGYEAAAQDGRSREGISAAARQK